MEAGPGLSWRYPAKSGDGAGVTSRWICRGGCHFQMRRLANTPFGVYRRY
ncbi:hypothetical protein KCP69_01715 [Salmonella enterica subsp. enterica]|nr:hypothetical protein KCP69_01715 [Salmonella enterica subsp. enterica]